MDVRCEKCSTEYELDESRLKPGGVTVKCTNCGHTFKVRRREAAASADVPGTVMGMPRGPTPATPAPPTSVAAAAAAGSGERQWLIRLENGETRSCRELATLQQWILAGEVTRDALISRSGKTWKLLGDIVELGTYFTIADEAKQQRTRRESVKTALAKKSEEVPRQTLVGVGPVSSGAMALGDLDAMDEGDNDPTTARKIAPRTSPARPASTTDEVAIRTTSPHAAGAEPPARRSGVPSAPASAAASGVAATVPLMQSSPVHAAPPAPLAHAAPPAPTAPPPAAVPMPAGWPGAAAPSGSSGPMAGRPMGPESMPWTGVAPGDAGGGPVSGPSSSSASGPGAPGGSVDGPMLGRLRQSGDEPAFAGGGGRGPRTPMASSQPFTGVARDSAAGTPSRPTLGGGFAPDDDVGPAVAPRGSRAGLWIAIASLAVIAGGFATVYFVVLRGDRKVDEPVVVPTTDAQLAATPDAGALPTTPDAAPLAAPSVDAGTAELASNVEGRMRAAIAALADSSTKDDAAALAMRARLATSIAQSLEDRAALLPASERSAAEKLRQKSKDAILEAVPLAARAIKASASDVSSNLAMADLLRLQGKPAKDLRRYLDVVRAAAPKSQDLALLDGLLLVKEGKLAEARQLWSKADAGEARLEQSGDVRLRFRTAVAALADGKAVDARAAVDAVMAAQPDHEGAKVLLARLDQSVADTDPLPPEEGNEKPEGGNTGGGNSGGGNSGGGNSGGGASPADSYDKLVKKADDLAEKSCTKAIPVYQMALDKTPNGISALIGLGFCHIDTKQFSSANSRFRTVLALQSKNERALWGIAQAYQEQGIKAKAVEAYRSYLEVFPNSAPAKRQIEQLGGNDAPSGGNGGGGNGGGGNGGGGTTTPDSGGGGGTTTPTTTPDSPAPTPAPSEPAQ